MFSKDTLEAAKDELRSNRVMADGGEDLPDYLIEENFDWDSFQSQLTIEVVGDVLEEVDTDKVGRRAREVKLWDGAKSKMEWEEDLKASIINVEAWLHDHWLETIQIPSEMELDDARTFLPDLRTAEVDFSFKQEEILKASRQRGKEDATHHGYVLGNWTYLAKKNDHVSERTERQLRRAFEQAKEDGISFPEDANCDEFGGGGSDY